MENKTLFSTAMTVLLLFASLITYGQQAEKTLVKSFNLNGYESVAIGMDAPVEVRTWNNPFLRVQIQISLENGSDALLKSLVQAGRYNLRYEIIDGEYNVYAPSLDRIVKIGGKPLNDQVQFVVFAPEGVTVMLPENAEEPTEVITESVNK